MTPLLVFLGAGIGGVARYGIGRLIPSTVPAIPWATLFVNVSGSVLIMVIIAAAQAKGVSAAWQAFLTIGICGGYTTFSAFSAETLVLMQTGHWSRAMLYAVGSVALCLLAAFVGLRLGAVAFVRTA